MLAGAHVGRGRAARGRKRGVGRHAEQLAARRARGRAARAPCARSAPVAITFGEHRVVVGADLACPRSTPQSTRTPAPRGLAVARTRPVGGEEAGGRVLGVDRAPRSRGRRGATSSWPSASGSPGRDPQLLLDQVEPVDQLGDRVLDLQPRVHLEEEELAGSSAVGEELDGAGADVAGTRARARPPPRRSRSRSSGVDDRRGRLLDDLLVAALQRALALAEVDDVAVGVAEHLDLDVARALEVALDEHAVVAEAGQRLAPGRGQRRLEARRRRDDAHPLAAAAGRGLDHHRVAVLAGEGTISASAGLGACGAGQDRHAGSRASCLAATLSPISSIASGGGPMKRSPASAHGLGEPGVLGEEAVAGMDRRAPRRARAAREQRRPARGRSRSEREVGGLDVRGAGVGVACRRRPIGARAGERAGDPDRDLAAVGDQDRGEVTQLGGHRLPPYRTIIRSSSNVRFVGIPFPRGHRTAQARRRRDPGRLPRARQGGTAGPAGARRALRPAGGRRDRGGSGRLRRARLRATSVAELAERLGLATGALYHYFSRQGRAAHQRSATS